MKILLVVPGGVTRDGTGDVIPVLDSFIARLARQCEVNVISVANESTAAIHAARGFRILDTGCRGKSLLGVRGHVASARQLIKKAGVRFDLIHSFWLGRPSTTACLLRADARKPWIASVGGQELRFGRMQSRSFIARKNIEIQNRIALGRADLITAGSKIVCDEIAAFRRAALWWPLFPDNSLFKQIDACAVIEDKPFRMITVADHNDAKDAPTLLKTLGRLRERGRDIRLTWIGAELQPGKSHELACSLGVADCVEILGHIDHQQIPQYLQHADLYVQSSCYESQGVSVCEAAACGLPIVGTSVGILPEIAPRGAIVVPVEDPDALADAVERVIVDDACRQRLSEGASDWMAAYSLDWTIRQALDFYAVALASGKGSRSGDTS